MRENIRLGDAQNCVPPQKGGVTPKYLSPHYQLSFRTKLFTTDTEGYCYSIRVDFDLSRRIVSSRGSKNQCVHNKMLFVRISRIGGTRSKHVPPFDVLPLKLIGKYLCPTRNIFSRINEFHQYLPDSPPLKK